ncbi:hypothetical protein GE21DRAFT_1196447 [Neurospora crassa]|nr:hypothetical protein GE21DRAFT_1196447 [Neurospora crassa]
MAPKFQRALSNGANKERNLFKNAYSRVIVLTSAVALSGMVSKRKVSASLSKFDCQEAVEDEEARLSLIDAMGVSKAVRMSKEEGRAGGHEYP